MDLELESPSTDGSGSTILSSETPNEMITSALKYLQAVEKRLVSEYHKINNQEKQHRSTLGSSDAVAAKMPMVEDGMNDMITNTEKETKKNHEDLKVMDANAESAMVDELRMKDVILELAAIEKDIESLKKMIDKIMKSKLWIDSDDDLYEQLDTEAIELLEDEASEIVEKWEENE